MSDRITTARLERAIEALNEAFGYPSAPYRREGDRLIAQPNNFHLAGAYGGYRVEQMCEGGGSRDVTGFGTKREVYDQVQAMLWAARELKGSGR